MKCVITSIFIHKFSSMVEYRGTYIHIYFPECVGESGPSDGFAAFTLQPELHDPHNY